MIPVLAHTTPEQRFKLYDDTETLITSGFLSHSFQLAGKHLAVRSLGPGDLFLLGARAKRMKNRVPDDEWKVWTIASSIWMLDGYVLLEDMNVAPRLAQALYRIHPGTREILFSMVMGLFNRQRLALEAVEAYGYEYFSRYKWKAIGSSPQGLGSFPGILGTNYVQQAWTYFNQVEDQRERDETLWEGFKLTVSPHAPKGIKKIDSRDKQAWRNELSRRQAVLDRFFYVRMGVLERPKKGERPKDWISTTLLPKTDDDLADEMYRWVTGQDDDHDRIIKEYKESITARYAAEKQAREAHVQALRQQQAQIEADVGPSKLVAYTPDQLQEILRGRTSGRPGTRIIQTAPSARDYLYTKYLERPPDPGLLRQEDGQLVAASEVRGSSLNEMIDARQVVFQAGEEE